MSPGTGLPATRGPSQPAPARGRPPRGATAASSRTPAVHVDPEVGRAFGAGVSRLVHAIRPTLGPLPRAVAFARPIGTQAPEILDSGGLIARRIAELPDRRADVGAMYLRQILWRLHGRVADGTATAAVVFGTALAECRRLTASGWDVVDVRHALEALVEPVVAELDALAERVAGRADLDAVARSAGHDPEVDALIGEAIDLVGPFGSLEIRAGERATLTREYASGSHWVSGLIGGTGPVEHGRRRIDLVEPAILASDLALDASGSVETLLRETRASGVASVLLIVSDAGPAVVGDLRALGEDLGMAIAIARTPGDTGTERIAALEDLAVLTGARVAVAAAGDRLDAVAPRDLGRARRAWADRDYVGLHVGAGDPQALRTRIAGLTARHAAAGDAAARRAIEERVGRLLGGSAIITLASAGETETRHRVAMAERTVGVVRLALTGGVLPGGGTALLRAGMRLRASIRSASPTERAVVEAVVRALEEPARTIAANSGHRPPVALDLLYGGSPWSVFDARTGARAEARTAGVLDAADVVRDAVRSALGGAALALTVEGAVHHRNPVESVEP